MMEYSQLNFPRGDGPLVSVILPTRGRPDWLPSSVTSLYDQAAQPDKIEFLFRVDSDDITTQKAASALIDYLPNARMVVDKRGAGYVEIHRWVNQLCRLAKGDWLLLWNDDAKMATDSWDRILLKSTAKCWHPCHDVYLYTMQTRKRPGYNEFPLVRKKVFDILGHLSHSPYVDRWLTHVFHNAISMSPLPLEVDHFSEVIGDQTRADSVKSSNNGGLAQATLESPEAQALLHQDLKTLYDYINNWQEQHRTS